jgi:hypothetical protein
MMLLCLVPKIPHILSGREKAKHHHCLGKDPQVPHMRDQKGSYKKESPSFIFKTYKNSRIKVDRRTRHAVLDLIVLSFNYLGPK